MPHRIADRPSRRHAAGRAFAVVLLIAVCMGGGCAAGDRVDSQVRTDQLLFNAIKRSDLGDVGFVLDQGARINVVNQDGESPLHLAAAGGSGPITRHLLKRGAHPNRRDNSGRTPLYWAAIQGNPATVAALLDAGADPDLAAADGTTPHAAAREQGHIEAAHLIAQRTQR